MITTNKSGTLKQLTEGIGTNAIKSINLLAKILVTAANQYRYHVIDIDDPIESYAAFLLIGAKVSTGSNSSPNCIQFISKEMYSDYNAYKVALPATFPAPYAGTMCHQLPSQLHMSLSSAYNFYIPTDLTLSVIFATDNQYSQPGDSIRILGIKDMSN